MLSGYACSRIDWSVCSEIASFILLRPRLIVQKESKEIGGLVRSKFVAQVKCPSKFLAELSSIANYLALRRAATIYDNLLIESRL